MHTTEQDAVEATLPRLLEGTTERPAPIDSCRRFHPGAVCLPGQNHPGVA